MSTRCSQAHKEGHSWDDYSGPTVFGARPGSIRWIRPRFGGSGRRWCARCGTTTRRCRCASWSAATRASPATGSSASWRGASPTRAAQLTSVGVVPTPAVAYLTPLKGFTAGVVISASHNPFEDNGIKVFSGAGEKFTETLEQEVEAIVADPSWTVADAHEAAGDPRRLPRRLPGAPGGDSAPAARTKLRVAIDCANGATTTVAPQLFRDARLRHGGHRQRARRPQHQPADAAPRRRHFLPGTVVGGGYALGIAFDGDGDRAIFVDAGGRVVDGDAVMLMCATALKAEGRLEQQRHRGHRDEQHRPGDRAARGRHRPGAVPGRATST